MHPIHDIDVLLLLATALAAKRRPAEPLEVVAAVDLIQGNIPSEDKLAEGVSRLGQHGLLNAADGRLALTEAAQKLVEALPRKGESAEKLLDLRGLMAGHSAAGEGTAIQVPPEEWRTAIQAHRAAAAASTGKNLLVPKPKAPPGAQQKPGQRRRKPFPGQRPKR